MGEVGHSGQLLCSVIPWFFDILFQKGYGRKPERQRKLTQLQGKHVNATRSASKVWIEQKNYWRTQWLKQNLWWKWTDDSVWDISTGWWSRGEIVGRTRWGWVRQKLASNRWIQVEEGLIGRWVKWGKRWKWGEVRNVVDEKVRVPEIGEFNIHAEAKCK